MRQKIFLILATLVTSSVFGTFQTDEKAVFEAAKKSNSPVIISFFGIWCPPCNQLDETVFESSGFLEKSKAFQLLKVDADAESSWKIKSRYKVGGYPTVVFTDSKGNELYRVVGYRAPNEFFRVMDMVTTAKGTPLEKACKSKKIDDIWRCATICQERKDEACAEKAFGTLKKKLDAKSERLEEVETYFADKEKDRTKKLKLLEDFLKRYPFSPLALGWALDYTDGDGPMDQYPLKKNLLESVNENFDKIVESPRTDILGLPKTDLLQMRAELLGKLARADEAKKAWKAAAVELERLSQGLGKDAAARGYTLERVWCLEQAGEIDAALKLSEDYRKRFPEEFTFHYQAASLLNRSKRSKEARPVAQRAYEVGYGDNKIRAATLLIELMAASGEKDAAGKVFEEINKKYKPDATLEVRTHRYLKKLAEVWDRAKQ